MYKFEVIRFRRSPTKSHTNFSIGLNSPLCSSNISWLLRSRCWKKWRVMRHHWTSNRWLIGFRRRPKASASFCVYGSYPKLIFKSRIGEIYSSCSINCLWRENIISTSYAYPLDILCKDVEAYHYNSLPRGSQFLTKPFTVTESQLKDIDNGVLKMAKVGVVCNPWQLNVIGLVRNWKKS